VFIFTQQKAIMENEYFEDINFYAQYCLDNQDEVEAWWHYSFLWPLDAVDFENNRDELESLGDNSLEEREGEGGAKASANLWQVLTKKYCKRLHMLKLKSLPR
jgi:hypothetical protein